MRVLIVNEKGVRFHTDVMKEPHVEEQCSCSRPSKSPRNLEMRDNDIFITVPDKEYVSLILRKTGGDKQVSQHNLKGVSIYTTKKYMVWVRFTNSYQNALRQLHSKSSLPTNEEKYILSTQKIDKIQEAPPSEIFVYESSFGDVFSRENYTGEMTSSDQQMFSSLKRSSYGSLENSYPVCWM